MYLVFAFCPMFCSIQFVSFPFDTSTIRRSSRRAGPPWILLFSNLSVHTKLQELLRGCVLPNEFVLPFDPRIKAGRIIVRHSFCKCIALICVCMLTTPRRVDSKLRPVGIVEWGYYLPFFHCFCAPVRKMQSDALQEEATVAGVLSNAFT